MIPYQTRMLATADQLRARAGILYLRLMSPEPALEQLEAELVTVRELAGALEQLLERAEKEITSESDARRSRTRRERDPSR